MMLHLPLGVGKSTQQFELNQHFLISVSQKFLHLENENSLAFLLVRYHRSMERLECLKSKLTLINFIHQLVSWQESKERCQFQVA